MARMIPHALTKEMKEKYNIQESEEKVFRYLNELPDSYVCVWSVGWSKRNEHESSSGEMDFIVIHPDFPLTVLEVKGGKLSCRNARWSRWKQEKNHNGENWNPAESPTDQVFENMKALVQKVRYLHGMRAQDFSRSAIVVLPDTTRENLIGLPGTYDLVLTKESFVNFRESLEKAMRVRIPVHNDKKAGIGNETTEFLYEYFSRQPEYQIPMRSLMELDNSTLKRLSADHYLTIDQLNREKKVVINGGAGTGKTVLAVQKVLREAREGRKTLLLCYNNLLSKDLEARIAAEKIPGKGLVKVCNFHQLCEDVCRFFKCIPQDRSSPEYFEKLVDTAMERLVNNPSAEFQFDSIVVDEGQDFRGKWWQLLDLVHAKNGNGFYWVFMDEFQNIQRGELVERSDFFSYVLLRNFRNSQAVFKFINNSRLNRFVENTLPVGPEGAICNAVVVGDDSSELKRKIGTILNNLVNSGKVSPENIAILTGSTLDGDKAKSVLRGVTELGGVPITCDKSNSKNKVFLETVRKFKGLENKYVILVEIDTNDPNKFPENEQLVYVGASRAVSALSIVAKRETLERLGFMDEPELPTSA